MLKQQVAHGPGGRVLVMDSIAQLAAGDADAIVVAASHGGASSAHYALQVPLALVVFNDAGVGKDGAGIAGLRLLQERGVAAAAVSHASARIGDAQDMWEHGQVSHVNAAASPWGLAPGVALRSVLTDRVSASGGVATSHRADGPARSQPQRSPSEASLAGLLVVALEQAVAAPYCSSRLADAGARVIKVERPEGDFARGYDQAVHGESSYFVWINRGKESIALDLKTGADLALLERMIERADVFIQNLAPGATERLGIASATLRARQPRLVTCDISGYGQSGPLHRMKAYDLLVQAESGLVAVSGAPGEWGRIGVSLCDINAGLNALIGIQQALRQRDRTGRGSSVEVSLFDSAAELMAVPYLQARYGGRPPERVGLKHPSIAPYGAFRCADGRELVISIQNEREWADFCCHVLLEPALAADPRCAGNAARVLHRPWLEATISAVFAAHGRAEMMRRMDAARTAYGSINRPADLAAHPQLRIKTMPVGEQTVELPAPPWIVDFERPSFMPAPRLDQHGAAIRQEFMAALPSRAE